MTEAVAIAPRQRSSHARDVWRRFRKHRGAMIGAVILGAILLAVVAGPWLWHLDPTAISMRLRNRGPSLDHPLGTDHLGRDMLARLIAGGRVSLTVGFTAMGLSLVLGTLVGVCAGFLRGLDGILMRLTDLFLALPLLPLLLVMSMLFREPLSQSLGAETGIFLLIVAAIGGTSWMHTARLVRGEVLTLKEREFVLAARSVGTRDGKMILRHILPMCVPSVIVRVTLNMAGVILTAAGLGFLGLGAQPPAPEWGSMAATGREFMLDSPWVIAAPGIAIAAVSLAFNLMGDALRDVLDPRGAK